MAYGMWDLPGPEIEPVSPELAGGFFYPLYHQGSPPKVVFLRYVLFHG